MMKLVIWEICKNCGWSAFRAYRIKDDLTEGGLEGRVLGICVKCKKLTIF